MLELENSYIKKLSSDFYQEITASPVAAPRLLKANEQLAESLGLSKEFLYSQEALEIFSGNKNMPGSIALAYAGHQFGHFSPQLGDGRALLLGELIDSDGVRRDLQLKGSGQTRFSRRGDGRSALGPVLREYLVSESMHALGVPTTRSLFAIATGESVWRETEQPGGVLTRVAASHLRVGTFEYFAGRKENDSVKLLADYALERHYPELKTQKKPYTKMFEKIAEQQAELISIWSSIGFIHGVMNTDNFSISGETIDYGPCAFMDVYHPDTVFSSIDHHGRYAYKNQPLIGQWNLLALAHAISSVLISEHDDLQPVVQKILDDFLSLYQTKIQKRFLEKIACDADDLENYPLVVQLLSLMQKYRADFTLSFRYLSVDEKKWFDLFDAGAEKELNDWLERWHAAKEKNAADILLQQNPLYIPRNFWLEQALQDAVTKDDYELYNQLLELSLNPYEEVANREKFTSSPESKDAHYVTFCGT